MFNQNKLINSKISRLLPRLALFLVLTILTTPTIFDSAVAQTQQPNLTEPPSLAATPSSRQAKQSQELKSRKLESQKLSFKKLEQPLGLKLAVAIAGLGLTGAELWWFVFSKPKS